MLGAQPVRKVSIDWLKATVLKVHAYTECDDPSNGGLVDVSMSIQSSKTHLGM